MELEEEYKLSCYKKIADISSHENVYLVQNIETAQIYVKKELTIYNKAVFAQLKSVNSDLIPRIYECIEDQGRLYLIEEYIPGKNLKDYLEENGVLTEDEILDLAKFLIAALKELHQLNPPIIHRDIKPSNIIRRDNGTYCLIDFNTARNLKEDDAQDTVIMGTQDFAAPEQYGFRQSDERTDIYGLGVTLNYLRTKKYPKEFIAPGRLHDVIEKCVKLDPEDRFQNIRELELALLGNKKGKRKKISQKKEPLNLGKTPLTRWDVLNYGTGTLSLIGALIIFWSCMFDTGLENNRFIQLTWGIFLLIGGAMQFIDREGSWLICWEIISYFCYIDSSLVYTGLQGEKIAEAIWYYILVILFLFARYIYIQENLAGRSFPACLKDKNIRRSYGIPGFRTMKWWKVIVAGFIYFCYGIFLFCEKFPNEGFSEIGDWVADFWIILSFILSVFYICNYRNCDRIIPTIHNLPFLKKLAAKIGLSMLVICVGILVGSGI